ncbi:hypothetical protein Adt_42182 [Abeliophyllum distichum]|uniref:Retrotransposon gag protein n=1 Tax=Abeliophyllum distichum TaxID=126358 RepID=A0ABD1PUW1_9LAMI
MKKDPKAMNVRPEDERSEQSCNHDDDDDDDVENENFPFSKELKARKLFTGFKMPPMQKYNGRGDPTDHINVYKTRLQGYIPTVKFLHHQFSLSSSVVYTRLKIITQKTVVRMYEN